jgi:tetratricopeptide (TPR) repeat protein
MPSTLNYYLYWLRANPLVGIVAGIFWLWMLVDAIRRGEWLWAVFMVFFPGLTTLFYFFLVYRATASATQGFELPGASSRRRIKELEGLIHNLDKPHHYLELGDIYFQKGNLDKAGECYRASLQRDAQDIDARAHLGQCLLRQKRAGEARPILQQICAENPKHDYGHSLMAYAETLASLGEIDNAIAVWKQVLQDHTYARARVQLGELYLATKQPELAAAEFREAISDDRHAPGYQRKRDRVWIWRARRLLP